MSHQDKDGHVRFNAVYLQQALQWLLAPLNWGSIRFRKDCSWSPRQWVATALLWAWSDESTLHDRFFTARRIAEFLYCPQREFAGSVQAFLKMLVRWTSSVVALMQAALRNRMEHSLSSCWKIHGFVLFGVDGSRIELPRTKANESVYATQRNAKGQKVKRNRRKKPDTAAHTKKADNPQIWLTLLWHAGTGLPWAWRTGPVGSSEREHWREMLGELPAQALVTADAGLVGYDHLKAVHDSAHPFLIRVGSNVSLLRQLGWVKESAGTVYLWPATAADKNQPPLVLRLIVATGGKHPVYLVTTVTAARLSDRQVIDVYRRRWGIELYFRHLKQTFGRRKLRSASPSHAGVELEWSLLGLWCMALYAQVELIKQGKEPAQLSVAGVVRAFQRMLRDYRHPVEHKKSLCKLLSHAIRDEYRRKNKASRSYPHRRTPRPPAGPPEIKLATKVQMRKAYELRTAA